jgi:2-isopropylmalate synthase
VNEPAQSAANRQPPEDRESMGDAVELNGQRALLERVRILDTTLRDGEQSPGATMSANEKVVMARQLEKLGVDVIEAGFAASSEGEWEAIRSVARSVRYPVVVSLARTKETDIVRAIHSVEAARNPGIHVFIASSDIHLEHKLGMSRMEVVDAAVSAVSFARRYLDHIEFSAEDASRTDPNYLVELFGAIIEAGASIVNVPDTTGFATPKTFGELLRTLIRRTRGSESAVWSAHCHNDLGLAVANSLAALLAGARQVECTVNGIGERAGNTALEELVMALAVRQDVFGLRTNVVTEQIYPTSRLLSQITGLSIPVNKPIVGANAFAHEAGIHQHGVLKHRSTYEIMRPESVGVPANRIVLGKHSGRHAFVSRLKDLGVATEEADLNSAFTRFKALADRKKEVLDEDLLSIVTEEVCRGPERYALASLAVTASSAETPTAVVAIRIDGVEHVATATGNGMVDACWNAIRQIVDLDLALQRYSVNAITGGTDAQGEVSCVLRCGAIVVSGCGSHTDVVTASALAFVAALNRLGAMRQLPSPASPVDPRRSASPRATDREGAPAEARRWRSSTSLMLR